MKLDELITNLSKKTNSAINQSLLAEALGITRQTVSNRIKNESEVTVSELQRVEKFFNIKIFNETTNNDIAYIDYYLDIFASCGNGNLVFSEDKQQLPISISLIKNYTSQKQYSIINASGNSMTPTINDSDLLLIEHITEKQIQDNKIYVFCYNDEIFVKRLSKNIDEIIVKSDNKEYSSKIISKENTDNLILIGKVIMCLKNFN